MMLYMFQNQNLSSNTKVCKEVIRNIVCSGPTPSKKMSWLVGWSLSWLGKKIQNFQYEPLISQLHMTQI